MHTDMHVRMHAFAQAARALRACGFKFGQPTPRQLEQLRSLHSRYHLEPDAHVLMATQLPGGWTSRQVASLLRKHGIARKGEWPASCKDCTARKCSG